jgi:hypothetical protein
VYKYHIFLIHSSVVGILAIVTSAVINMGGRCLWNNLSHIPLDISLGVVLLGYMADLCLVFKDASILVSKVVLLAYIPTSSI